MALCVDQSDHGVVRVDGADRVRFLGGMCTGNIESLGEGAWLRTCLLSPKGRVLSVFDVTVEGESLVLVCEPALTEPTVSVLQKHAIIDDVAFTVESRLIHRIWSTPASVWTAVPVFAPCPTPSARASEAEVLRVEAGWPKYGVDVSDKAFPFESLLGRFIDYQKGCYVGQEPVARVHARGAPQRFLRGIKLSGSDPAAPGATIGSANKANAGAVTSSVVSPTYGPIAMGYVHRSAGEPGGPVEVEGRPGELVQLPFGGW